MATELLCKLVMLNLNFYDSTECVFEKMPVNFVLQIEKKFFTGLREDCGFWFSTL